MLLTCPCSAIHPLSWASPHSPMIFHLFTFSFSLLSFSTFSYVLSFTIVRFIFYPLLLFSPSQLFSFLPISHILITGAGGGKYRVQEATGWILEYSCHVCWWCWWCWIFFAKYWISWSWCWRFKMARMRRWWCANLGIQWIYHMCANAECWMLNSWCWWIEWWGFDCWGWGGDDVQQEQQVCNSQRRKE